MGLLDDVLTGAELTVELAGLPAVRIDLTPSETPNPILKLLRPRVTVRRNGNLVVQPIQPYGPPEGGPPIGLIALGLTIAAVVFLAGRLGR